MTSAPERTTSNFDASIIDVAATSIPSPSAVVATSPPGDRPKLLALHVTALERSDLPMAVAEVGFFVPGLGFGFAAWRGVRSAVPSAVTRKGGALACPSGTLTGCSSSLRAGSREVPTLAP